MRLLAAAGLCETEDIMAASNLTILNERLSQRPEPLREDLAGYIVEHLDEIELDMNVSDDGDLRTELLRREAAAILDPREGKPWADVKERVLSSRSR